MGDEDQIKATVEVPFPSARLAEIAYHVLRVDGEPKRSGVSKEFVVKNNILEAKFTAGLAKQLRVALTNFFENVGLIADTVEFAGDPVSEKYDYFY